MAAKSIIIICGCVRRQSIAWRIEIEEAEKIRLPDIPILLEDISADEKRVGARDSLEQAQDLIEGIR